MNAAGNITFGLKLRHLPRDVVAEKLKSALELVGLTGLEKRHPAQLSGGQQQRVALARSLVLEPKILLLDEPFSSLDAHLRIRLREELKAIQRRLGLTTVFVTHDQEEAMSLADRIVVMNRGTAEQIAAPGIIYDRPATLFAAGFIGTMTMLPAKLDGGFIAAGPLRLTFPHRATTNEWMLALRPEDCVLVPPGSPHSVPVVIDAIVELGSTRVVTVSLEDGTLVKVQIGRRDTVSAGDRKALVVSRALAYRDGRSPLELLAPSAGETAPEEAYREELSA